MIGRIKNTALRRALLIVSAPVLVPLSLGLDAMEAVYEGSKAWVRILRKAW